MLIINVKDAGNIDKALKEFKWKFRKSGQLKNIRDKKEYTKPSTKRREQLELAKYKQKKFKHIK